MVAAALRNHPRVRFQASAASEFLISLATMSHTSAIATLEAGPSWVAATERRAGPELLASIRAFSGNSRYPWIELLHFVARWGDGLTVADLVARLGRLEPRAVIKHVIGCFEPEMLGGVPGEMVDAALDGDRIAREQVLATQTPYPYPQSLLRRQAQESTAELLAILETWQERVWPGIESLAMPVLLRDTRRYDGMLGAMHTDRLIATATRGVTWMAFSADISNVLLMPTYVGRPWVMNTAAFGTMTIVYPVSDASLGPATDVPIRRLARLSAAVHAPHGPGILRELWQHELSLPDLAERLGCPSDRLLQDLLHLRAAGFVTVDAATHHYSLNEADLDDLGGLVDAYLGLGRADVTSLPAGIRA